MGKTAGKDAAQDKSTFVSVLGLQASKDQLQTLLAEMEKALAPFGTNALPLRALADLAVSRAAASSDAGSTATGPAASQSVAAGPAESPGPEDTVPAPPSGAAHPPADARPLSAPAPPSDTAPRPRPVQDPAGPGAAPHRRVLSIQDVTRSDLPPAPPSGTAPPTSPYAQRLARARTPEQVCAEFYEQVRRRPLDEPERRLVEGALDRARDEQAHEAEATDATEGKRA